MTIIEFLQYFPDENSCKQHFKEKKEKSKELNVSFRKSKKEELNNVVIDYINQNAIIFSDKNTSYVDFAEIVDTHITSKSDKETTKTTLKWIHIAISNAKRNLLGVYHMIKGKYLQTYLNEFC